MSRNVLQRVQAAILEADTGPGYEVGNRARNQYFPRLRSRGNARPRVHGDAAHLFARKLDLAGMQAGANLDPERRR